MSFSVAKRQEARFLAFKTSTGGAFASCSGMRPTPKGPWLYKITGGKSTVKAAAALIPWAKPVIKATTKTIFQYFAHEIMLEAGRCPDGVDGKVLVTRLSRDRSFCAPFFSFTEKLAWVAWVVGELQKDGLLLGDTNMLSLSPEKSPELWERSRYEREANQLLKFFQTHLHEAETLLKKAFSHWGGEDPFYRFFHQSFKVYHVQPTTLEIVCFLERAGAASFQEWRINRSVVKLLEAGTKKEFDFSHNKDWFGNAKPILDAFLYMREFLRLAVKYAKELEDAPRMLPSGWAALLYYYNKR